MALEKLDVRAGRGWSRVGEGGSQGKPDGGRPGPRRLSRELGEERGDVEGAPGGSLRSSPGERGGRIGAPFEVVAAVRGTAGLPDVRTGGRELSSVPSFMARESRLAMLIGTELRAADTRRESREVSSVSPYAPR